MALVRRALHAIQYPLVFLAIREGFREIINIVGISIGSGSARKRAAVHDKSIWAIRRITRRRSLFLAAPILSVVVADAWHRLQRCNDVGDAEIVVVLTTIGARVDQVPEKPYYLRTVSPARRGTERGRTFVRAPPARAATFLVQADAASRRE